MDPDADNNIFAQLWLLYLNPNGSTYININSIVFLDSEDVMIIHEKMDSISKIMTQALEKGDLEANLYIHNNLAMAKSLFLSYGFQIDDTDDDVLGIRWV